MMAWRVVAFGAVVLMTACASKRLLTVENRLLQTEAAELQSELVAFKSGMPDPGSYVRHPDLKSIHEFLDRAKLTHEWESSGKNVTLTFTGRNTTFGVNIQHFPKSEVLFMSTSGLFYLRDVQDPDSLVLLLVHIAALNFDMLVGKFQLNPQSGEVLLSAELHLHDGLGYDTFVRALNQLCTTADQQHPRLAEVTRGRGL